MKFLLVLLVVGVGLWMLTARLRKPGAGGQGGGAAPPKPPASVRPVEMVVCAHCGVHLPLSDAVSDGAQVYCGEPHRLAGPRSPDQ